MKKKLKLRKQWKVLLGVLIIAGIIKLFSFAITNFNQLAKDCDKAKGYTCTIYDVQQFNIRGRK